MWQIHKSQQVKEKVKLAHTELVESDFMTKMSVLPVHLQLFIKSSDFNHYYILLESCLQGIFSEDSSETSGRSYDEWAKYFTGKG